MTIIGHCKDGYHSYCGGEMQDRGDGSWVRCECQCHNTREAGLSCPDCGLLTSDGQTCGECLSVRAEYYMPDEGGC